MFPPFPDFTASLVEVALSVSEPLALLTLGVGLLALSFRFRSPRTRAVTPLPKPQGVRSGLRSGAPLATQQGPS